MMTASDMMQLLAKALDLPEAPPGVIVDLPALADIAGRRILMLEHERATQAQEIAKLRDQLLGMTRWAQIMGERGREAAARAEKAEAALADKAFELEMAEQAALEAAE